MAVRQQLRVEKQARLEQRGAGFSAPAFVARVVVPLVPELNHGGSETPCDVTVVRSQESGRITLRYAFPNGPTVYVKAYSDGLGATSAEALRMLAASGFGPQSLYQVPEVLGFVPEENLLVMREAVGESVKDGLLTKPVAEVRSAVARAAEWLAYLHAAVVPAVRVEPAWDRLVVHKVSDMLAKASAKRASDAHQMLALFGALQSLAPRTHGTLVPTHGQYTPSGVFLDGDRVSVIDLDRLMVSDPAKDVAMFMHRCAGIMLRQRGDAAAAELLSRAFEEEYRARARQDPVNLPYYLAVYSLKSYAKCAKDFGPDDPRRQQFGSLYLSRLERCVATGSGAGRRHRVQRGDEPPAGPTTSAFVSGGMKGRRGVAARVGRHEMVVRALHDAGFAAPSRYRVPAPRPGLAAASRDAAAAVRPGPCLSRLILHGEWPDAVNGAREAARWLARLHGSSVRLGRPSQDWESLRIFRICRRLISAAAEQPGQRDLLLDLMHSLNDHLARLPAGRERVQSHGRFAPSCIFLSDDGVVVTDLGRSRPADPARDAAGFVGAVERLGALRGRRAVAAAAADAFLEEYRRCAPTGLEAFAFYRSAALVLGVFDVIRAREPGAMSVSERMDAHLQAMRRVMELRI
jgi:aminoglycoside phosphotransferase (APT) family kinase protein